MGEFAPQRGDLGQRAAGLDEADDAQDPADRANEPEHPHGVTCS